MQYITPRVMHFTPNDRLNLFIVLAFSASWTEMHVRGDPTKKKKETRLKHEGLN